MASSGTSTRLPPTLLTMPAELHNQILGYLDAPDLQTLRLSCNCFFAIISPPTHADLLKIEASLQGNIDHFACVGCTKIRPRAKFSPSMLNKKKMSGGSQAHSRFCNDCGKRPLPGLNRWMLGNRWEGDDVTGSYVPFVRCLRCRTIARAPADKAINLCLGCHTFDMERMRAAEEVCRVRREMNQREEGRILREARGHRIATNSAASNFSEYDWRSEGEEEDSGSDDPIEDAMNYSNCS